VSAFNRTVVETAFASPESAFCGSPYGVTAEGLNSVVVTITTVVVDEVEVMVTVRVAVPSEYWVVSVRVVSGWDVSGWDLSGWDLSGWVVSDWEVSDCRLGVGVTDGESGFPSDRLSPVDVGVVLVVLDGSVVGSGVPLSDVAGGFGPQPVVGAGSGGTAWFVVVAFVGVLFGLDNVVTGAFVPSGVVS
jgi:hypothetical protein